MRLLETLGQRRRSTLGQLHGLEAGPQALGRVELRRISGQPIPQQGGPLAAQEAAQLGQGPG